MSSLETEIDNIKANATYSREALVSALDSQADTDRYLRHLDSIPSDDHDRYLATLISLAEYILSIDSQPTSALLNEIDRAADKLLEQKNEMISDQLGLVALASTFHLTGNSKAIGAALEVVSEYSYRNETTSVRADIVKRMANTGLSVQESQQIETSKLPFVADVQSLEPTQTIHSPLGADFEELFDPQIVRPKTPTYTSGGVHPSLRNKYSPKPKLQ